MLHIRRSSQFPHGALALLSLCSLAGCDSLWNGFTTGDPSSCVYSPSLCSSAQFCNSSTGKCEATTIPPVDSFSYLGIFPSIGRTGGNEAVDIRGSGFTPDTVVKIAGLPLQQPVTQGDGSTIHGSTPRAPGRCGRVSVEVNRTGFPPVMRPNEFLYKFEPFGAAPINSPLKIMEEVTQIASMEFSGDMLPDLVVATTQSLLWVKNQGSGGFSMTNAGLLFSSGLRFAVGSFLSPTSKSVALINYSNDTVKIVTPTNNSLTATGFGQILRDLAAINLDAQGNDDLVFLSTYPTGTPSLTTVNVNAQGGVLNNKTITTDGISMTAMAVLDLTADGKEDVVVGSQSSSKLYYAKADVGGLGAISPVGFAANGTINAMVAADWDQDGTKDLAVLDGEGVVTFLKNGGNAQLIPMGTVGTTIKAGAGGMIARAHMQAYDVNCDGLLDLVISPPASVSPAADMTLIVNNGTGRFVMSQTLPMTGGDFAFADFNQDTLPDFAIRQSLLGSAGMSWRLGLIP